jgi:ketosteroid isomerase-like protein
VNSSNPEEVALRFVECINHQGWRELIEMMAEDFVFIGPNDGDVVEGREAMGQGFREYFEDYPDYKIHVSKVTRSGDAVAFVGRTTGSHVSPEIEAKETVIFIATVKEDLVTQWRIFSDMHQFSELQVQIAETR